MKACLWQLGSRGGLPTPNLLLVVPCIEQELSQKNRLLHLKGLECLSIRHGDVDHRESNRRWDSTSATKPVPPYG
jgi:hypothetical protein